MGNYIADATELCTYFPQTRLVQLAADSASQAATGLADTTVAANIAAMIVCAESEINGELSRYGPVPVSPVPERLKLCTARVTVYMLASRKQEAAKVFADSYSGESMWLKGAAVSELGLVKADGTAAPESSAIRTTAQSSSCSMTFGRGGLDDFS